jgi:uncharacterized protein YggE
MRFPSRLAGVALWSALAVFAPLAAAHAADSPPTISVSGSGEVRGVPNQAQLSAGVATTAATADAALVENARKMTAVFDALKTMGVPENAIQTSNFAVSPQYSTDNQNASRPQRIIGYQVSNQVDVLLDDTKKLGPALDALVGAGANQVNSVGFSIRDPNALLTSAREAAVADAMTRARTYAKAAGVMLGPILSIQDGGSNEPSDALRMVRLAGVMRTPTAAGEQSITASVSRVFAIK